MTSTTAERRIPAFGFVLAGAGILGGLLGVYGTALSLIPMWLVGPVLALVGGVVASRWRRWGVVLLVLGVAMLLGFAVYVGIGLLTPDGPSSGEVHG